MAEVHGRHRLLQADGIWITKNVGNVFGSALAFVSFVGFADYDFFYTLYYTISDIYVSCVNFDEQFVQRYCY